MILAQEMSREVGGCDVVGDFRIDAHDLARVNPGAESIYGICDRIPGASVMFLALAEA